MKIGIVIGSIRKNSFSESVAKGIIAGLPEDVEVNWLKIDNLPLYNQDYDEDSPAEYTEFRNELEKQDAIIFVTPEHNLLVPAALKNAIDVGSRPYGQNKWAGKPALVASQSPGAASGMLAAHALRQSLAFLDMVTMQQPLVHVNAIKTLNEDGSVAEGSVDFLKNAGKAFYDFAKKLLA